MATADDFAQRLRELRTAAELTQRELATRAGMTEGGVRDLEQGRRKPTWATVLALASALGVEVGAFAQPAEQPEPGPAQKGRPRKTPAAPPARAQGSEGTDRPDTPPPADRSSAGQGEGTKGKADRS